MRHLIKSKLSIFYITAIVVVTVVAIFCFSGCAEGNDEPLDITDVYARGVEVEYDGLEHGIVIENLVATDVVYYRQADGTWQTDAVTFSVPGEYTVEFRVERPGYKEFSGSAVVKIKTATLSGVYSVPRTVICDGGAYGINIIGSTDSDTITYSIDGELFESAPILFSEVGEHVVFFRVVREYAEYGGTGIVTVLPDIRGEYVNLNSGVITVTDGAAIIGDAEQPLSYGVDGVGTIGESAFSVTDGVLAFGGFEYVKKQTTEKIYELQINAEKLYIIGGDYIELDIAFTEGTGTISVDGVEVMRVEDVNYCESADADRFFAQISAAHTEIELSQRAEQTVTEDVTYVIHDGEKHRYETNYDGVVWYSVDGSYTTVSPEFDSVGRHETQALYKKDGYLPASVTVVMEIVRSIYGVYYDDGNVICISPDGAQINGQSVTLEFESGQWTVGGDVVCLEDGKLKNQTTGGEYTPTERAVAIEIGAERIIMTEAPTQLIITAADDGTVTVARSGEVIMRGTLYGDVAVTVNGRNIAATERSGTKVFTLGVDDLSDSVTIIRVALCESV